MRVSLPERAVPEVSEVKIREGFSHFRFFKLTSPLPIHSTSPPAVMCLHTDTILTPSATYSVKVITLAYCVRRLYMNSSCIFCGVIRQNHISRWPNVSFQWIHSLSVVVNMINLFFPRSCVLVCDFSFAFYQMSLRLIKYSFFCIVNTLCHYPNTSRTPFCTCSCRCALIMQLHHSKGLEGEFSFRLRSYL